MALKFEYREHKVFVGFHAKGVGSGYLGYWRIVDPRDETNVKMSGSTARNFPSMEEAIEAAQAGARKDIDEFTSPHAMHTPSQEDD